MNRWTMSNTWVVFYDNLKIGRNVTYNDVAPAPATPPANQAPVARAGNDITISLPTILATLDGSGSTDADGTIDRYSWSYVGGPQGSLLANPLSALTLVNGLLAGTYTFRLTVTDDDGATSTDDVRVIVNPLIPPANVPPVAAAGNNQAITLPTSQVTVNGNGSTDSDGSIQGYIWSYVTGPTTYTITTPNSVSTTITGLTQGTYTFRLTVRDDDNATSTDDLTITVNPATPPPNTPPVANAGNNQVITLPTNSVTLNSTGSTDADGTIQSYRWGYVNGPATYSITNATGQSTTVTGLVQGTYIFRLTVWDDDNALSADDVTVTVNPATPPPNTPPVPKAGTDIVITLPTNQVTVNGNTSTDADGTIQAYNWAYVSGPATFSITNANSVATTITGLVQGVYVFRLTVRDDNNATAADDIRVTVNPAPVSPPPVTGNQGPIANAGNDAIIEMPVSTATLYGTGSTDPDGLIVSYEWTQLSGPTQILIANNRLANIPLNDLMIGEYVFQLKVTDNFGASATATVKIIVRNKYNEEVFCNVYPNPTRDYLKIQYASGNTGKVRIMLYDANNRFVFGETVQKGLALLTKTIDISRYRSGTYFLELTIGGSRKIVRKVIKL
jgi:hypothetical protein